MKKIKKILSFFTSVFVAASLALSSSTTGALGWAQIREALNKIVINYNGASPKLLKDHNGWVYFLSEVLLYAEVTAEDITTSNPPTVNDFWANYIASPNGFKAAVGGSGSAEERSNIEQMLNNFNHNDRYWQSGYRIKDDYKFVEDWGLFRYTVEDRNHVAKSYETIQDTTDNFRRKYKEVYNLDPAANAQKYDLLCLRAILRALVEYEYEYDNTLGQSFEQILNISADMLLSSSFASNLVRLITNDPVLKEDLRTNEDFSMQNRDPRPNAVDDYRRIANLLIYSHFSLSNKERGKDYQIVFDENGFVAKIEPISSAAGNGGGGGGSIVQVLPNDSKSSVNGVSNSSRASAKDPAGSGRSAIKETGLGVEHFATTCVAVVASLSGIVGVGYVVSRRRSKKR